MNLRPHGQRPLQCLVLPVLILLILVAAANGRGLAATSHFGRVRLSHRQYSTRHCSSAQSDSDAPNQHQNAFTSSREERMAFRQTTYALLRPKRPKHDPTTMDELDHLEQQVLLCAKKSIPEPIMEPRRPLLFWENMVCGAISRSIAQTVMHPANTMKTILQSARGADRPTINSLLQPSNFKRLSRGAGANFLLSVPHGAVNFAVLEFVRTKLNDLVQSSPALRKRAEQIGPGLDFLSSSLSTICCSIVSTPQMMITDNIMAGNYNNMPEAIRGLWKREGVKGFYAGWWPGLAGKIPSYALTWTLFQRLKAVHRRVCDRDPTDLENSIMGSFSATMTVCIMIPMDTIKTRLVTQASMKALAGSIPYKGIVDCAIRVAKEEGFATFYRGLPPRLVSVVPMIGIQFGVYEFMRKVMVERSARNRADDEEYLQQTTMEVAASLAVPYPAPHFHKKLPAFTKK